MFYVLKGRGHDVHDGRRIDWKAGDIMIVENGCVHQHFNDDPDNEAILLVFKAKPLFLFMHLCFRRSCPGPPETLPEGPRGLQNRRPNPLSPGDPKMKAPNDERDVAHLGDKLCSFRAEDIVKSASSASSTRRGRTSCRRGQPWERSPDGLIKHLVNQRMKTRECCIDAYMQFLPPGARGQAPAYVGGDRVFVVEGQGFDLHWDLKLDCVDLRMGMGGRSRISPGRRRFHLRSAVHHPSALRQPERGARSSSYQPDRQSYGFRLVDQSNGRRDSDFSSGAE